MEHQIVAETDNLYLFRLPNGKLEMRLNGSTHSVVVGNPSNEEAGRRFMDKAERHIGNLRAMYQHF